MVLIQCVPLWTYNGTPSKADLGTSDRVGTCMVRRQCSHGRKIKDDFCGDTANHETLAGMGLLHRSLEIVADLQGQSTGRQI